MASFDLETVHVESGGIAAQHERSRLETLIRLAKDNRRSIEEFQKRVLSICTINEKVAEQCLYALPRTAKGGQKITIEGPSIRMAEIVLKAWRNAGVFGSIVDSGTEYVTAQAVFIDFEDLTMSSTQSRRRVLGSHGDARMLAENASISVARRNAILGAIPRALWVEAYERAKAVAAGSIETLEERRREAIAWVVEKKISEERIFAALDVKGIADVGLEQLSLLRTLVVQVRGGEMTADQAFPDPKKDVEQETTRGVRGVKEKLAGEGKDATETARPV